MQIPTPSSSSPLVHSHVFDDGNPLAERNTKRVVWLTALMMVVEIAGGWVFNSMALLADGWHMSSHALALGLSAMAYAAARRFSGDQRFAFGTWKIEILGGYTSAILLVGVAASMLFQSVERLITPSEIHYDQAITIAIVGLVINLVCAWLLKGNRAQGHSHGHGHEHGKDLNLRAAYLHVLADAATSVLAIVALCGGKLWAASWLDPVMGIVGAGLVAAWAYGLLRDTGPQRDRPEPHQSRDYRLARLARRRGQVFVHRVPCDRCRRGSGLLQEAAPGPEELVHITVELNPWPS